MVSRYVNHNISESVLQYVPTSGVHSYISVFAVSLLQETASSASLIRVIAKYQQRLRLAVAKFLSTWRMKYMTGGFFPRKYEESVFIHTIPHRSFNKAILWTKNKGTITVRSDDCADRSLNQRNRSRDKFSQIKSAGAWILRLTIWIGKRSTYASVRTYIRMLRLGPAPVDYIHRYKHTFSRSFNDFWCQSRGCM